MKNQTTRSHSDRVYQANKEWIFERADNFKSEFMSAIKTICEDYDSNKTTKTNQTK